MATDFWKSHTIGVTEEILINGFLRSINSAPMDIPPLVYTLCVSYRLGSAQHLWSVDPSTLQQMKDCESEREFLSPIFDIEGLLWQFKACPNGTDDNEGSFDLFIKSVHMPSSWQCIECCIIIQCLETLSGSVMYYAFPKGEAYGWPDNAMEHSEIESLESLSFSIEIQVHRIILKKDELIFYERDIVATDQCVEWNVGREMMDKLRSAHVGKQMACSTIYGGMYCLMVERQESHIDFCLILCALPKGKRKVDSSWTFEMMAKGDQFEKVDTHSMSMELTMEGLGDNNWWHSHTLSVEDLMKSDSLVFKVNIMVHDEENDARDQKTIDYWSKLVEKQYVEEMKENTELPSIPKTDDVDKYEKRFDSLEGTVMEILTVVKQLRADTMAPKLPQRTKRSEELMDSEDIKLKKWMVNVVKLPQYFELLMENGFEDMESMKDITMEHLREIGIDKIGHRLKLMKAVAALRVDDFP